MDIKLDVKQSSVLEFGKGFLTGLCMSECSEHTFNIVSSDFLSLLCDDDSISYKDLEFLYSLKRQLKGALYG